MVGKTSAFFATLAVFLPSATAQVAQWGQCGGVGYTGSTTCASGSICQASNSYYSQCIPGTQAPPGGATTVTITAAASTVTAVSTVTVAAPQTTCVPVGIPTTVSVSTTTVTATVTDTTTVSGTASCSASAASASSSAAGEGSVPLNQIIQAAGKKYLGSATDNPELTNTAYVALLSEEPMFGQITPGNSMKWDATEPEQGTFTWSGADQIVDLAEGNGQLLRGHNCVWYNQLPDWVTSTNWTADELTAVVANHCGTIVGHYAGQIYSWDVINEPFNDDGTWRSDVFYDTLNETFIPTALNAARAADPKAKLYINEYNLEYAGPKFNSMFALVQQLQADGVPIDGVGFQGHLIVGEVPTDFQEQLAQMASLGVEVAITELDIRMTLPETDALLAQQETDYQNVIAACMAVEGCVGITLWDYTDEYSWVPGTFSGQGAACPWDDNLQVKPAYYGIVDAIQAA